MTKYKYRVELVERGVQTIVTRLSDNATKTFFVAGHTSTDGLTWLMESITDEQAESYFPKPRKK